MKKIFCTLLLISGSLFPQMIDPSIDKPDEPFCYYRYPTDVIGIMDGSEGTLVSPEGYLYTGSGELMFFTGYPQEPIYQRVKTLLKNYLPVIEYKYTKDEIEYNFQAFASTLSGNPDDPLINFIRIKIKNKNSDVRTAWFSSGFRYQNPDNTGWGVGDNRFGRPAKPEVKGEFEQAGDTFSINAKYTFEGNGFYKDGKLIYIYPQDNMFQKMMVLKMGYNEQQSFEPQIYGLATTPVGIVQYKFRLNPGEEKSIDFKFPYLAVKNAALIENLNKASYDYYLDRTIKFWDDLIAEGIDINVPEEKVNASFKANLIYDLIARDKLGDDYVQKVNEFQYDAFWLRDAATILRMYDISGYHNIAKQCLDFFPRWQQPDGNFVSHGGQYDGWGQTMWAYGQHYLLTHDLKFAESVYPAVIKAFDWLKQTRQTDSLHLIPVATPGDNENITGRVTGHNFLALAGLKNIITLAEALKKNSDAKKFRNEYTDYFDAFIEQLKKVTSKTGGYITPGLDMRGGQDWGNLLSVYPEIILDPFDHMVSVTLDSSRAKYQEGIMTYGDGRYLHHYLTLNNTQTELLRGEQQKALEEFYAVLMHTSATHAGFEFAIWPWSTRDFGMNLSPHGWFSAEYRILVRNMMLVEEKDELHLLSIISPDWIKDGAIISVKRAPSNFGVINFDFSFENGKAILNLQNKFIVKPSRLILHLPWFMNTKEVRVDGKVLSIKNNSIQLPLECKIVEITWTKKSDTPEMSYLKTVDEYKKEYRRRYEEFIKNGTEFK